MKQGVLNYIRADSAKAALLLTALGAGAAGMLVKGPDEQALKIAAGVMLAICGVGFVSMLKDVLWPQEHSSLNRLRSIGHLSKMLEEVEEERRQAKGGFGRVEMTEHWVVAPQIGVVIFPLDWVVAIERETEIYKGRKLHRVRVFLEDGTREVLYQKQEFTADALATALKLAAPWAIVKEGMEERWPQDKREVIAEAREQRKFLRPEVHVKLPE